MRRRTDRELREAARSLLQTMTAQDMEHFECGRPPPAEFSDEDFEYFRTCMAEEMLYPHKVVSAHPTLAMAEPKPCTAVDFAIQVMTFVALLLPRRVANEQLGDALEEIHGLYLVGRPRWHIWVRTIASVFWAFIAAFRTAGQSSAKAKG